MKNNLSSKSKYLTMNSKIMRNFTTDNPSPLFQLFLSSLEGINPTEPFPTKFVSVLFLT